MDVFADLIYLGIEIVFFVLSFGLIAALDRMMRSEAGDAAAAHRATQERRS